MSDLTSKTAEELREIIILWSASASSAADELVHRLYATESLLSEHKRKHDWWRKEASRLAAELDEAQHRSEAHEVAAKALEDLVAGFHDMEELNALWVRNKAAEYRAKAGRK